MENTLETMQRPKPRIKWHRSPVDRETLIALGRKSDLKGILQIGGHLLLLCLTGVGSWLAAEHLAWPWAVALVFIHCTFYGFLANALHEFVHDTVFKTKGLNRFFLWTCSFLYGYNPIWFWTSHTEHHKYTLHPPDDLEVTLPVPLTMKGFLSRGFVDLGELVQFGWCHTLRLSFGYFKSEWECKLFPESDPVKRRPVIWWTRTLLIGHGIILGISIYTGLWVLPLLTTFAPYIGRWLMILCNLPQHAGLVDNVPDYRLCCRTFTVNPFVQFLYWHMNYHTEHHMYASIPCYNLGKLHRKIRDDLPYCPHGLIATWRQIIEIVKKQKADPTYQYLPQLNVSS
jgi:fatty acid desaturase